MQDYLTKFKYNLIFRKFKIKIGFLIWGTGTHSRRSAPIFVLSNTKLMNAIGFVFNFCVSRSEH